jgi:hypothetical protein
MMLRAFRCSAINRITIIFFVSLVSFSYINAQYTKNLMFGFKAGAAYSGISNLSSMIVSESYYTGYTLTEKDRFGPVVGFFVNYKFEETSMAIQPELTYAMMGGLLNYSDVNGLNYQIDFRYEYVKLAFLAKAYITKGFHALGGPCLAYNISPTNLLYTSNGEALYGPDLEAQQQMRNVLKGKSDFSLVAGLGYEFKNGINIEASYLFGLKDVIETQVNSFKFIENSNKSHSIQLTVGFAISSDGKNFK